MRRLWRIGMVLIGFPFLALHYTPAPKLAYRFAASSEVPGT